MKFSIVFFMLLFEFSIIGRTIFYPCSDVSKIRNNKIKYRSNLLFTRSFIDPIILTKEILIELTNFRKDKMSCNPLILAMAKDNGKGSSDEEIQNFAEELAKKIKKDQRKDLKKLFCDSKKISLVSFSELLKKLELDLVPPKVNAKKIFSFNRRCSLTKYPPTDLLKVKIKIDIDPSELSNCELN